MEPTPPLAQNRPLRHGIRPVCDFNSESGQRDATSTKKATVGGYDLRPGTAPVFVDTLGATESNARIVVEFGADDLLFSHKNAADTSDAGIATAFVAQNYANRFIVRKTVTLTASTKPVAPIHCPGQYENAQQGRSCGLVSKEQSQTGIHGNKCILDEPHRMPLRTCQTMRPQ